jgi:SAM-dependent MidA family methyltransferase
VTPLAELLTAEIAAQGPLRFDRYMARVLFDPQQGYYASGRARIGRGGDFYTNVGVGRIFGRVLAAQAAEIWERLGQPGEFTIVEQGANDGRLATDILAALHTDHPACHAAARYILVEPFASLAKMQRATLSGHADKVEWGDTVENLPTFTGLHLTNEYADALPIRLFVWSGAAWLERHVGLKDSTLAFEDHPTTDLPFCLPAEAPKGYLAETRPEAASWVASVAGKLARGAMLTIDYGFSRDQLYAPWRQAGTLSCYRAHRRDDDPLESPGDKDLTAHVDFTGLAEAGASTGLELAGFADQYHFLVGAGTSLLLAMETMPPSAERDADLRAFKSLLHPEIMGTQFKYLALTRGLDLAPPLAGFRHSPAAQTVLF